MKLDVLLFISFCTVCQNLAEAACDETEAKKCGIAWLNSLQKISDGSDSQDEKKSQFCSIVNTYVQCYKSAGCYTAEFEKNYQADLNRRNIVCGGTMASLSYVLLTLATVFALCVTTLI